MDNRAVETEERGRTYRMEGYKEESGEKRREEDAKKQVCVKMP